jgi:formylglycine-generating enzyme required for sulfatase activity
VTQGQWQKVMGNNPYYLHQGGKDCPVEKVTRNDAQAFIRKLDQMENTDKYRLPTEAEWENACRAKGTGRFSFSDNEANLQDYAWSNKNSADKTHPVGQKQPNAWGLHDMHGNVWEWCQDWYGQYGPGPVVDPKGPEAGKGRGLHGGSWGSLTGYLRSTARYHSGPVNRYLHLIGFRVARTF